METQISNKEKNILFWSSFIALMACGIGFGVRVLNIGTWSVEFNIDGEAAGAIFGASLWPIAVGMILFSLIVDKIGHKVSMLIASALLVGGSILTMVSTSQGELINSFLMAGFAHGIIEACINPLCATMYKKDKSKMLNILHASWPAGIVVGASICLAFESIEYRDAFIMTAIAAAVFGLGFIIAKHIPQDERVENNVSYVEMLREFGGLSIFLATTFLFYELSNQIGLFAEGGTFEGKNQLLISGGVGAVVGIAAGIGLKAAGKPLFFILCLIMIPLATAEIATDGWIQKLMQPVLTAEYGIDSGWAIVLSSFIMMSLRFFAGIPLRFMSPPTLLLVSSLFSIAGLFLLSEVSGILIFLAFVLYGIGQTFYWPTVLGFTSEQFPKGGAMTLNTVSAMGLLTVGIFGVPFLGVVADNYNTGLIKEEAPALYAKVELDSKTKKEVPVYALPNKSFFGMKYDSVKSDALLLDDSLLTQKGKEMKAQTVLPDEPTKEDREKVGAAQKALAEAKLDEIKTKEGVDLTVNIQNTGRKTLKVAALLPTVMGLSFLLIIFYFKAKGGYKPVVLGQDD